MSWFPALLPTGPDEGPPHQPARTVPFYTGILDLPTETLLACWADEPRVEDSRFGAVLGAADFRDYLRATREWLALSDALTQPLSLVASSSRSVEEVTLQLEVGGDRQEVGAAVVTEWDAACRLTGIRVYHSTWPLPSQFVHVPVLPAETPPALPPFVAQVERARAEHEGDAVLDGYEEDAEVASFDAVPQVLRGRDQLRRLVTPPEVPGRTVTRTVCSVTDDGRTCAVEYLATPDGASRTAEAGLTSYVRSPSGRIAVERRYRVQTVPRAGTAPGVPAVRPVPRAVVPPPRSRVLDQPALRRAADG